MFSHESFKAVETLFNGIHIGLVEDNIDPDKAGKVRVRIAGIHTPKKEAGIIEGIPTVDLPWALPANPIAGGSVSGLGESKVPVQGSWVILFFIGGNHNRPVYFATIPGFPQESANPSVGFNDPDAVYPEYTGNPDWNQEARGEGDLKSIKDANLDTFEPASPSAPEYPFNDVTESQKEGIIVEHDSTPGNERWHVYHKASKCYVEFHPDGSTVLKSTKDHYQITANDRKVYIKVNDAQKIDGNRDIDINGLETKDVAGTMSEHVVGVVSEDYNSNQTTTVGGTLIINISGTTTINSTGKVTINGGTVDIDGGGELAGIINGLSICHLTGLPIADVSTTCKCSK